MDYLDLIKQFLFQELPIIPVEKELQFEAVSAEVFGTKQRRLGPMPSPEQQTVIRQVIRDNEVLQLFVPWACSKQWDHQLDVAEFYALKQLRCLQESLARLGKLTIFTFRVENLTDQWLFGSETLPKIQAYKESLSRLIELMLPNSNIRMENSATTFTDFKDVAGFFVPVFYRYLKGETTVDTLAQIGWKGDIPPCQQKYYLDAYQVFYPGEDHLMILARYFAATLARINLKADCLPKGDCLQISFTRPVPGYQAWKRLYYRTIPERYTHCHQAPWIAKGHFCIDEQNNVVPKLGQPEGLVPGTLNFGGVNIQADYLLV